MALRDKGYEVLLTSPPGAYGEKIRNLGFRWYPAPMNRRSLNPLRESSLINWLRKLIIAEKVDLVHSFTIKCSIYGSVAARLAPTTPATINAVAGLGYVFTNNSIKARTLRPLVRKLMQKALSGPNSRLVLQNQDDVTLFLQQRLAEKESIRLIRGSGVNCEAFSPSLDTALQSNDSTTKVLLPARLLWDKGVGEFVDAARKLKTKGCQIAFLLAGEPDPGNPAAIPTATIRAWETENLVTWLGHVDDMHTLFRKVDIVALPSYREGLPKGLIEAAACGKPLITTDVPGCREVVTNKEDGLLIPVRDSQALSEAICRLHKNPELRRQLGKKAREKALSSFDELIVIERTLDVYDELISRPNRF
ncbi:MAG: glycosyltransferase family 4 protein [Pigmentiphaga sp.]|nr:glycosyltransferase family 4 protein [Pigmentiphaga sp.]